MTDIELEEELEKSQLFIILFLLFFSVISFFFIITEEDFLSYLGILVFVYIMSEYIVYSLKKEYYRINGKQEAEEW